MAVVCEAIGVAEVLELIGVAGEREAIRAAEAWVLDLPPNCQDLYPIENAFGKIMEAMRKQKPRT